MDARIVVIPMTLIVLSAVTLWYAISAKGPWWFKLSLMVLIPFMGLYSMHEMVSYQGYPTSEQLPAKGFLLQVDIREPDPQTGDKGAVNVWVRPITVDEKQGPNFLEYDPMNEPRAYRLPYSRRLHENGERARQMIKDGRPVMISRGGSKGEGEGDGEIGDGEGDGQGGEGSGQPGEGNGRRRGRQGGRPGNGGGAGGGNDYGDSDAEVEFYDMPPVNLPPKDP